MTRLVVSREIAMRGPHGLEADVWSIGCMLYTLLVGRPPFDTHGVKNTLNKVILAEFDLPDHLSPEARHLIQSLLQKNPKERLLLDCKYSSTLKSFSALIFFNPSWPLKIYKHVLFHLPNFSWTFYMILNTCMYLSKGPAVFNTCMYLSKGPAVFNTCMYLSKGPAVWEGEGEIRFFCRKILIPEICLNRWR